MGSARVASMLILRHAFIRFSLVATQPALNSRIRRLGWCLLLVDGRMADGWMGDDCAHSNRTLVLSLLIPSSPSLCLAMSLWDG